MDIPATGGRFRRDPETGALTPLPEEDDAAPAGGEPAVPAAPPPSDLPVTKKERR